MRCPGPLGSGSPMFSPGLLCCVCGIPRHLAPVHRCPCSVRGVVCAVSCATWLLFASVLALCVVLRVRCPGPLGSSSPVCSLGALHCVCGVLGPLAPVNLCARWVRCVACAVSSAPCLLFTSMHARCIWLRVWCPGPLGSCSAVCSLGALCCACCVLAHLGPVQGCARSVCCRVCAVSWAPWLLFTGVTARCVVLRVRCHGPLGSCSPVCLLCAFCCVCGFLGHLAPIHRCACSVRCVACAVLSATSLLFTGMHTRCVALRVRCPGPLGSCSPICTLGALRCMCGVLGHLASAHRCACSVLCVACAVSRATWLLLTGVPARCFALCVRCPEPLGSCSPVCLLGALCSPGAVSRATWLLFTDVLARSVVLRVRYPRPLVSCSPVSSLAASCCVRGVLGHLAPVRRCARLVCCVACAVSGATWLLFTGVLTLCVLLCVRWSGPLGSCSPVCSLGALCCVGFPRPLGSCSPVCSLGALFCMLRVLGHLAPVCRCARLVRRVACTLSWATWLLFSDVLAQCIALRVRCPGPLGSCSPVCPLGALCCVCGVLGHLAPVHRRARSVCGVVCAVSWATWLLCSGVLARCVVLCVQCPGSLGSCSAVFLLGALCCVCGVLGHSAPVPRRPRSLHRVACAVSWTTWLLFIGVSAQCVVFCVRCPGPLGSCSPVCPLGALCCVCSVLGQVAPVHQCAGSVRCVACAVSLATCLLFTDVPARCVVLRVHCPWSSGSCSPVWSLGALCCVCGVLGHLAPVPRVPARCVVLRVRCPAPLFPCSPVWSLGVLCGVCGVLRHLAPVHQCARPACCVACPVSRATLLLTTVVPAPVRCVPCAVSWATSLLFAGVLARCVLLCVRCPGPLGSCSPACLLGALCCVCGVLGHLAPVLGSARSVRCFACAVSLATWLMFAGVLAWCVVLRVRCPGPLGSCSRVCSPGALCSMCGVLGHLPPVHRCACPVRCVACAVSWVTWLLFTDVLTQCIVLRVWCPEPLGSCSPLCPLVALYCVCSVLGHLAPVHQCARLVCRAVCALSWATWLLFTGVLARRVVLHVRCPGHLAPVWGCARLVCCVARAGRALVHPDNCVS